MNRAARTLLLCALAGRAAAKVVDGIARLSSQDTEIYLTKFSFSPRVAVRVNGSFHTDERDYLDNHPHALTLCLCARCARPLRLLRADEHSPPSQVL